MIDELFTQSFMYHLCIKTMKQFLLLYVETQWLAMKGQNSGCHDMSSSWIFKINRKVIKILSLYAKKPRSQDFHEDLHYARRTNYTKGVIIYLIDFLSSFFSVSFSSTSIGFIFYNSIPTFLLTFEIPSSWQIFLNSSSSIHPLPLLSHLLNNISNRLDMIHW